MSVLSGLPPGAKWGCPPVPQGWSEHHVLGPLAPHRPLRWKTSSSSTTALGALVDI